jgi:RNA polymerase sigma-70 factor, ECF subfamily
MKHFKFVKMSSSAEVELLNRCRNGEAFAWDELFKLHYAATGRFIFQLANHFTKEDVEEICQETFLSIIKNIGTFNGKCQFQTWLFRIASNKAQDYRQRQQAAKRGGTAVPLSLNATHPDTGLTLDPPSMDPSPDMMMMNTEHMVLITESLNRIGNPCREIIELRYFGDLSYEEISKATGLNSKTVSSRLSKCLDQLEKIARTVFSKGKSTSFSV